MITPLPGATPLVPGSCTLPFPGVAAAIVDEQGHDVPNGTGGILVIKKPWPSMIRTIWGDPERYKKSYYPEEFQGRYYLAGDGASRDAKTGYFTITGRIDDVLNVSGHRMGTMEIESALVAHTGARRRGGRRRPARRDHRRGDLRLRRSQARPAHRRGSQADRQGAARLGRQGDRPDRQAEGHPLRRQPAEDAQRQDHAPPAALDRAGPGDHAGHLDAREPGDPGAAGGEELTRRAPASLVILSEAKDLDPMTPAPDIAEARRLLDAAARVVVLTGAGISTESGIPDFRGPKGVWTRNPAAEKQSTIQNYLAEPEVRKAAWRARLDSPAWSAEPNAGHRALVELERRGKLFALVTQNIDELHQRAGQSPALVVEVHGSMRRVMCWECGRRAPMEEALLRVRGGEDDPHCRDCGGILKSDTISFGQSLVPEVIDRALNAAAEADLLLAVGTTLQVQPVASMVPIAARAGANIVIVNDQPTAMDGLADVVVREPIGSVLPAICADATARGP
jgi:NAD-dependent deacetylase